MLDTGSKAGALVSRITGEYPVRLAFWGSLLLSLIAVLGTATVGRDAAFYIDIAQQVMDHGPKVAWQTFDWPWFSYLLAGTHIVLHVPLELSAYLWCGVFLAGTCALMVDCVRQRSPENARWACLVVLAMPAVNAFRNDIIREYGFWFFCTLALWLALRWQKRGGWLHAAFIHLAIVAAALFRLEALLMLPALALWQLSNFRSPAQRKQVLQFVLLPVLGLIVALASGAFSAARVSLYLDMLSPHSVFASFNLLSEQFSRSLINKYSQDEAGRIIFFGIVASMLISFVKLMGPFAVPFVLRSNWSVLRIYWRDFRPFAWTALLYAIVLVLFYLKQQFMNTRYLSFLNLLFVPVLATALAVFVGRFPRWGKALVVLAVLVMLSNVISISPGKTHYVQAGHWVAEHIEPGAPAYFEDGRISYYAGRGYALNNLTREDAMSPAHGGEFRYFLIDARGDEPWLAAWLTEHKQRILARFANRKGATVLVIGQ
ncbi:glycosyltransferase family 39 protein [Pseudomonas sp. dw_612]|uniref:glycosyltransferase family 39 protein n=1 Tax=Pseudomonas sp. dw_612 TaxID=2720080 RepID=UPI001BD2F316|nr:glycosyltransferase family 39 protein [Pseudomonas sp. dw_612]